MSSPFSLFNTTLELADIDYLYLTEMRNNIYNTIGLDFNESELIGIILKNMRTRNNYLKIVTVTPDINLSLTEVENLTALLQEERTALEWLKNSSRRSIPIKNTIEELKDAIVSNDTLEVNALSKRVHQVISSEYNKKYSKNKFGAGVKKLVIKAAIAYLVLNETTS